MIEIVIAALIALWVAVLVAIVRYEWTTDPDSHRLELLDRCPKCKQMMGWKHQYSCVAGDGDEGSRAWG